MAKWNIVETPVVEKRKTRDGRKVLNNYELLQTLGQGQFGKVKLCERIPAVATVAPVVTTESTALEAASDLLGPPPPPPAFMNGASVASVAVAAEPKRRQFAIKIFSKKALLKMKEYVAEPPQTSGAAHSDSSDKGDTAAAAGTTTRMRVVTALDHVRDEIAIMRTLYHRNIVLLFEVIESESSDKVYMVLEVMARGQCMVFDAETKQFASPLTGGVLTDAWAKAHVRDILSGLNYLHSRRVCHRDLKPGNVLLNTAGRCHLTDFGCAKVLPNTTSTSSNEETAATTHLVSDTVGTYQFVAPECCSGVPYDPFKVDVWATGILLYIFLYGRLPFEAESTKELFDEITKWDAETDLPPASVRNVAPACRDLLMKLLKKDPNARISVAGALHHPWLRDEDEDEEPLSF